MRVGRAAVQAVYVLVQVGGTAGMPLPASFAKGLVSLRDSIVANPPETDSDSHSYKPQELILEVEAGHESHR